MSVQNLFQENDYDLYANGLNVNKIDAEDLQVSDLTIVDPNSTANVNLACNVSSTLVISNVDGLQNIYAGGIQFSTAENTLEHYLYSTNDYVFTFDDGINTSEITCQFSRIGNIINVQVRGYIYQAGTTIVSTTAVPSTAAPTNGPINFALPVSNVGGGVTKKGGTKIGQIDTNGIISIFSSVVSPSGDLDNGVQYFIGLNDANRLYFTYGK